VAPASSRLVGLRVELPSSKLGPAKCARSIEQERRSRATAAVSVTATSLLAKGVNGSPASRSPISSWQLVRIALGPDLLAVSPYGRALVRPTDPTARRPPNRWRRAITIDRDPDRTCPSWWDERRWPVPGPKAIIPKFMSSQSNASPEGDLVTIDPRRRSLYLPNSSRIELRCSGCLSEFHLEELSRRCGLNLLIG